MPTGVQEQQRLGFEGQETGVIGSFFKFSTAEVLSQKNAEKIFIVSDLVGLTKKGQSLFWNFLWNNFNCEQDMNDTEILLKEI